MTNPTIAPRTVFIYGSCVTRDTVEFFPPDIVLSGYVARQSLISAMHPCPAKSFDFSGVTSSFQRRMYELDVVGGAPEKVISHGSQCDLVLWDLTDERLGVVQFGDGFVTRNVNHATSGFHTGDRDPGLVLDFGTNGHYDIWAAAAKTFIENLRTAGVLPRVRVMRTEWAESSDSGDAMPAGVAFNANAERYYDFLRQEGLPCIDTPASMSTGKSSHKWGLAPFHFTDATYLHIVQQLQVALRL